MHILKVRFRTSEELDEHYQPDLPNGGLFCPTTNALEEGQAVMIELSMPALPNKVLIRGAVRSWRPALPPLHVSAGAVVEFLPEEDKKRAFVLETLAGTGAPSPGRRHTRMPMGIYVRYRTSSDADFFETKLTEIRMGGAMLATPESLPVDTDVILEITEPGAVSPTAIAGKVAHHERDGGTWLKFVDQGVDGSRRLRELVRRLRQS